MIVLGNGHSYENSTICCWPKTPSTGVLFIWWEKRVPTMEEETEMPKRKKSNFKKWSKRLGKGLIVLLALYAVFIIVIYKLDSPQPELKAVSGSTTKTQKYTDKD